MCGITGLAGKGAGDPLVLKRMTDALAHRGPDGEGLWVNGNHDVGLGHRRLAIIDLSDAGAQPMASASERFVLCYNGEIYNYRELREELIAAGYPFRGHSDSEVIVAGCDLWGLRQTVERLAGMFAMAIWDQHEKTLFLVRDRIGIKPMYYGVKDGVLAFGSELRPLVAWRGELPEISVPALTEFLRVGCVPGALSIFEGISKLKPASILTFRNGAVQTIDRYWSVRGAVERGLLNQRADESEIVAELDRQLRGVVAQHMISDVPLGAFLSGGIDSSTVTAVMQAESSRPVKTFSIGFTEAAYNEAPFAAEIAKHLGTDHTELYVTESDAREVIPLIPDIYDEPFADMSQIPTFLVSKLARQQVTVSLSGDGGDELFGGYNRYTFVSNYWARLSKAPRSLRKVAAAALGGPSQSAWDSVFAVASPVLPRRLRVSLPGQKMHKIASVLGAASLHELQARLVSQWANPESAMADNGAGASFLPPEADSIPNISSTAQQMAWDTQAYLVDDILTKVDRASMSVGLEARVPLLDHRIVEFAWEIPTAMNVRDGMGKWILRRVLEKYVPQSLFQRPKMGFGVPVDAWLRGPLKSWAEGLIRNADEHYFNRAVLAETWAQHISGRIERGGALWCVLMFESWLARARQWA